VWMDENGILTLYSNIREPPNWGHEGVIFTGAGARRQDVHLADLDGDKRCDYLVVNPDTGETKMFKNVGKWCYKND
jgi:hypothetical protein